MDHDNFSFFLFSSKRFSLWRRHTHNKRYHRRYETHTAAHCFCILLLSIHLQQHTNTCPFMLLCYLYCYSLETNFPVHENRPYLEAYDWKETWICLFVRVLFVCIFTISTLKYFILCCKNSLFFWWFVRRYHWLTISFFMKRFCGRK